jgi:peroxiredoxin Q/BCP
LVDQHGERHMLRKWRGRIVVLYFYPKDNTSVCTIQACQFRDHHPDFSKIDAAILGVSPDDVESHALFAGDHKLGFPLLADVKKDERGRPAVCGAYGVWQEKTMYGRRYMGVVRTTYLIDEAGVVRRRWDRVRVTRHAVDVLGAVKELKGLPATAPRKRASVPREMRAAGRGRRGIRN